MKGDVRCADSAIVCRSHGISADNPDGHHACRVALSSTAEVYNISLQINYFLITNIVFNANLCFVFVYIPLTHPQK
jgi:hypothetical protein